MCACMAQVQVSSSLRVSVLVYACNQVSVQGCVTGKDVPIMVNFLRVCAKYMVGKHFLESSEIASDLMCCLSNDSY